MKESFIERLNSELSAFQIENRKPAKYIFIGKEEGGELYFNSDLSINENEDLFYSGVEVLDVDKDSFFLLA